MAELMKSNIIFSPPICNPFMISIETGIYAIDGMNVNKVDTGFINFIIN